MSSGPGCVGWLSGQREPVWSGSFGGWWTVVGGRWSVVGGGLDSQVVAIKAEQAIICSSNPGTF